MLLTALVNCKHTGVVAYYKRNLTINQIIKTKMNEIEKVVEDNVIISGKNEDKTVVDIIKSISAKEVKRLSKQETKYEIINAERIYNKAKEAIKNIVPDEKKEFEKLCKNNNAVAWVAANKSQLKTKEIIEEGEAAGMVLSVKDARMIKKERRVQQEFVHPVQGINYCKTLEERVGRRGMLIILTIDVIYIIKAKCPMPRAARAYQIKAVKLAKAQTDNTLGYFSPAFSGLATFITNNGKLLTAIKNFEAKNGTGTAEDVAAAKAKVKIYVDKLVAYVNGLCIDDQTNAPAIISNAGMLQAKQRAKNQKDDFSIKHGTATGEIILTSLSAKFENKRVAATYYWQYGLMIDGVLTWFDLPDTINKCETTAKGMPVDTVVYFRKATHSTKGGRSAWCKELNISPK